MILERVNNTPSMQYQDLQQEPGSSKTSARLEMVKVEDPEGETDETRLTKPLVVYIDGPFGAPTSQIFRAQHAVLIGTGIGVTPFASILQSIMHRYWQARNTCPKCQYKWTNDLSASVGLNLRKVTLKLFLCTLRLLQVFISGRLLLDQSRSKVLWMVRQSPLAIGDRTSWTRRSHGAIPWHAYVHHFSSTKDRHEGRWTSASLGSTP